MDTAEIFDDHSGVEVAEHSVQTRQEEKDEGVKLNHRSRNGEFLKGWIMKSSNQLTVNSCTYIQISILVKFQALRTMARLSVYHTCHCLLFQRHHRIHLLCI